jgi:hypothetical protein
MSLRRSVRAILSAEPDDLDVAVAAIPRRMAESGHHSVHLAAGDERAALEALSDLVDSARVYRDEAEHDHRIGTAQTFEGIATQLDRVRTRLTEEHGPYLAEAWAFVDAGRLTIARHLARHRR